MSYLQATFRRYRVPYLTLSENIMGSDCNYGHPIVISIEATDDE